MSKPFPLFKDWIENCKKVCPTFCRNCPFMPGVVAVNYTENLNNNASCPRISNRNKPNMFSGSWFPDGDYKTAIKMYSNSDPEGLKINYYFKMKTGDTKSF